MLSMCNKNVMIICAGCVIGVLTCGYARGSNFSDEAELAYVDSAGNTEVVIFSAKNTMKYAFSQSLDGRWKASGRYGKSGGEKNVERYKTELRMNYLFARKVYSSVITKWLTDEFAGIDWRYHIGPAIVFNY